MNRINSSYKNFVFLVLGLLASAALVLLIGLYDVVKIDWLSFMEIQPSYRPMEKPLPVAFNSIPVEGAAYIGGTGDPVNPIPSDKVSVERGRQLYSVTCIQCHGAGAAGDGSVGYSLVNKPANLTSAVTSAKSDGAIFLIITDGIIGKKAGTTIDQIRMPALNENLTVRDRWDVVNFIRSLQAAAKLATPTPNP